MTILDYSYTAMMRVLAYVKGTYIAQTVAK